MPEPEEHKVYVGIEPGCGCVTLIVDPAHMTARQVRLALGRIVKEGRFVDITTLAAAQMRYRRRSQCEHRPRLDEKQAQKIEQLIDEAYGSQP